MRQLLATLLVLVGTSAAFGIERDPEWTVPGLTLPTGIDYVCEMPSEFVSQTTYFAINLSEKRIWQGWEGERLAYEHVVLTLESQEHPFRMHALTRLPDYERAKSTSFAFVALYQQMERESRLILVVGPPNEQKMPAQDPTVTQVYFCRPTS